MLDEVNTCVVVDTGVCLGPQSCCSGYRNKLMEPEIIVVATQVG